MTMPHLMNCSHSEDGWCLDCVKALWKERRCDIRPAVDEFSRLMERQLRDNHIKASPTSSECFVAIQKHLCFIQECDRELSRSCNERDREDLMARIERRSADLANWLMLLMGWDINKE